MDNTIKENSLFQNYVSPLLCSELKYARLNAYHTFLWKIYDNDIILETYTFDADNYYLDGNKEIDKISPPNQRLPAWTIKELERFLPDFCLSKVNNSYQLAIDENYKVDPVNAERLPDVFAKMMIQMINQHKINVDTINNIR